MALQGTSTSVLPLSGGDLGLAAAGSFYVCTEGSAGTPSPGVTGLIGPVATTLDETKALLSVYNAGTLSIYPKYLRLHVLTIGTTGTRVHFTQAIDSGPQRFSTGGTALNVNNTSLLQPVNASQAQVQFGALTLAAASANRRFLFNTTYKAVAIETVEDTYQFSWGGAGQLDDPASLSTVAAAQSNIAYAFGPVEIGPGHNFIIHQWRASITVGITFGVEFGFVAK